MDAAKSTAHIEELPCGERPADVMLSLCSLSQMLKQIMGQLAATSATPSLVLDATYMLQCAASPALVHKRHQLVMGMLSLKALAPFVPHCCLDMLDVMPGQ